MGNEPEDDVWKQIQKDLTFVPHFLQCDVLRWMGRKKSEEILERLQLDEEDTQKFKDETPRNENFISLLQFHLGKSEEAEQTNSSIRARFPNNLTAVINLYYFKVTSGREYDAAKIVSNLEKMLSENPETKYIAIAEEAYCLSRIKPKYYLKAIDMFQTAIEKCPVTILTYLWKFGCALTCRRCLNLTACVRMQTLEQIKHLCDVAMMYLTDIITNCPVPSQRARAFVELGQLYFRLQKPMYPLTLQIVQKLKEPRIQMRPNQCFEEALKLEGSDTDQFILSRCGSFLRLVCPPSSYAETLKQCYELLLKAYDIRKTAYTCDKIATILLKMIENDDQSATSFRSGRSVGKRPCRSRGRSGDVGFRGDHSRDMGCSPLRRQGRGDLTDHNIGNFRGPRIQKGRGAGRAQLSKTKYSEDHVQDSEEMQRLSRDVENLNLKDATVSRRVFKKFLNSPSRVQVFHSKHQEKVKEAEHYLKQSNEITKGSNIFAIYKLGLLYRQSDEKTKAIDQFRRIISDTESDLYHKINAYEQLGFCYLDMSKSSNFDSDEQYGFREESKLMMKRSIEQAAKLVALVPSMSTDDHDSWQSLPLLKDILTNESQTTKRMQELAHLCELVGNHKESLDFYKQLSEANPNDHIVIGKIIEEYVRNEDFQNAQTCLHLMLCAAEGKSLLEHKPNIVFQVYLGATRHFLQTQEAKEKADDIKNCLQSVFQHKYKMSSNEEDDYGGDDDDGFDVYVLSDEDDENDACNIADELINWLQQGCGLYVTHNSEDVPYGQLELRGKVELMTKSKCLVVVMGKSDTNRICRIDNYISIASSTKPSQVIVPVRTSPQDLPTTLKGRQLIEYWKITESPKYADEQFLHIFMALLGLDYNTFPWLECGTSPN